jgi:RNA polymerase sigma-70 factor, ECF subfamily
VRFLVGVISKFGLPREIRRVPLNGGEGFAIVEADGALQTWSLDWNPDGQVRAIYSVRNPDKLRHIDVSQGPPS